MPTQTCTPRRGTRQVVLVAAATALAWAGFFVHNVADLPAQSILSPESLYPTLVTLSLLVLCLAPVTRTVGTWLLLGWTALNLVGGLLSVLPLPFLPFVPAQTPGHYAFHGLYAVTQLPLLWLCVSGLRDHVDGSTGHRGYPPPPRGQTFR